MHFVLKYKNVYREDGCVSFQHTEFDFFFLNVCMLTIVKIIHVLPELVKSRLWRRD